MTRLVLALVMLGLLGGCAASTDSVITLRSDKTGRLLEQRFARAYAMRNQAGETDIVLVAQNKPSPLASGPREPGSAAALLPSSATPLSQVMHIGVKWNAMPNVMADSPSTTNAVIDWVVSSYDAAGNPDMLHYAGAGYVWLDVGSRSIKARVRNATLSLRSRLGSGLEDPLGNCTLHGTVVALLDSDATQRELALAQQQITAADAAAAAGSAAASGQ